MTRFVSFIILMSMMISLLLVSGVALAQDGEGSTDNTTEPVLISEPPPPITVEPPPETITMTTEFPKLEAIATESFVFNVEMTYKGDTERVFDLNAKAPSGWDVYINPQYDSKRISSITMEPAYTGTTKTVKITATGPTYPMAEPGEYSVFLDVSSDEVVGEIELIAKVTARYSLGALPASERYNTNASAGKDNIFSINVANIGTAAIENITFTSDKPDGWEITFEPNKIDLLEILDPKTVDVNIKPPPKTVAGDYMITLGVSGTQATAKDMDIRVTVKTPTIWGWIGVGIIVVVVVGLAFIFMRFGRR